MPQALLIVKTLIAIFAMIPEVLASMDALFPPGSPQGARLATAKATIQAALATEQAAAGVFEQIWPVVQAAISVLRPPKAT